MKKLKLLPTILMLVLCVGVLAIGIYAVTPTKNTISGSITINASNPEMIISVYGLNAQGQRSTTYYENKQVRSGMDINLGTSLVLDASSANTTDELKDLTLDFEIEVQNPTSTKMAVYFTTSDLGENVAKTDIKTTTPLTTTGGNKTLVKANMSGYMAVPAKGTDNGVCSATLSFELNDFASDSTTVNLSDPANVIYFCIDEYKSQLDSNTITLQTNGNNVSLAGSLVNTLTSATANLDSTTTTWAPSVAFNTNETYSSIGSADVLRMQTAMVKFNVTNSGRTPVKVSLVPNTEWSREDVTMVALNNPYIPAGGSGEVSLQFSYNREDHTTPTADNLPDAITGISYTINVEQVEELDSDDIKARIQYDNTGIGSGAFKYYIEYGTHNGTPLRWFIWAKDNGSGTATALESDDITGTTNGSITVKSNAYYFISEYVLDVSDTQTGISFNNEYSNESYYNADEAYASDYKTSNLRRYLNGEIVRWGCTYPNSNNVSAKASVNMFDRFGLTNDPLYGKISARTVETGCTDKFWALSYNEAINGVFTTNESRIAYQLSSTTTACSWWLRSPSDGDYVCDVYDDGNESINNAYDDFVGSRPAFQITI